jgi:hypothetical protein
MAELLQVAGSFDAVIEVLKLVHLTLLALALPFATTAAWGYRETPWGSVLVPLPGVGLLLLCSAFVFTSPAWGTLTGSVLVGVFLATAAGGTLYMSIRVVQVFGGGRGW